MVVAVINHLGTNVRGVVLVGSDRLATLLSGTETQEHTTSSSKRVKYQGLWDLWLVWRAAMKLDFRRIRSTTIPPSSKTRRPRHSFLSSRRPPSPLAGRPSHSTRRHRLLSHNQLYLVLLLMLSVVVLVRGSRSTRGVAAAWVAGGWNNKGRPTPLREEIIQARGGLWSMTNRRRSSPDSSSSLIVCRAVATSAATTATTRTPTGTSTSATASASSSSVGPVELRHLEYSKNVLVEEERTNASPPPVLFLHGLLGNKRNFVTIGASLSQQLDTKRRLIGLDLRNHGANTHDWRMDMSYRSMAYDVVSFLDRNDMDQAVIVGHSMGGKVAQALALLYPERVHGLVVLDIAPVQYTPQDVNWKAVRDIVSALESVPLTAGMTRQQVDQHLRTTVPDPALRSFCLTNFDVRRGQWNIPLHYIAAQLDSLSDFDIDPTNTYSGDAFFIHGGQSRFVRSSHMPTISQYFPNHLLTTIRGAGHWIHAEAPDDTTALLKKFLDR